MRLDCDAASRLRRRSHCSSAAVHGPGCHRSDIWRSERPRSRHARPRRPALSGGRWPMLSPEAVSGRYARPA
eukprot:7276976-Prymnesium_polylepis.1